VIDDASVYGLDSDLHLPGDGGDFDGPGARLSVAAHDRSHGNNIAHGDNRTYRQPLANGDAAALDGTADRHGDGAAGSDAASDHDSNSAMRGTEPASGGALYLAHGDANADSGPDLDAEPDYRPVSGESFGWGLPAALLFRAGE
jgi:hypothetical protein